MTAQDSASRIFQNRSFKGLDLTGVDFSHSDLWGCDFTGATLVGANFSGAITGQSQRQVNTLIAVAITAPAVIVSLSILVIHIPVSLFGDRFYQGFNFLLGGLPFFVFLFELLFRDSLARHFPRVANFFGVAATALLFQVMVSLTIGLIFVGLSGFDGLFLLVIAAISALMTYRIFRWVTQAIQSSCGTSFRKAILTNANLSFSMIENTDFRFAELTGVCIFESVIQRHNQFADIHCEYLYLELEPQKRHPIAGSFRQGEAEQYLSLRGVQKNNVPI